MSTQNLMKVTYYDQDRNIRLTGYADTVVWDEQPSPLLAALRFGGYPEAVRGLSDAIYGGATITIESDNWSLQLNTTARQYRRELGHDGVYAEATLVLDDDGQGSKGDKDKKDSDDDKEPEKPSSSDGKDDFDIEEVSRDLPPRNTYIFCTPGNRRELFDAVDQKTAVPMIPEYQDYVLQELERRGYAQTMQHKAIRLMANKLAAAGIIEGSFSEEGLAAMSECEDMATLMAKELMLGIKDSVEDLAATFKRMALLKPLQAEWSIFSDTLTARDHTKLVERTPDQPVVEFAFENHAEAPSTALNPRVDTIPENEPPTVFKAAVNPRKRKKFEISEDQIMLFKIA